MSNSYCDNTEEDNEFTSSDKTFQFSVKKMSSSQNYRQAPTPVELLYQTYFTPETIVGQTDYFDDNILFNTTKKQKNTFR